MIAKDYEDLTASPYYESNSELQALAAALKDFGTTLTKEYKREMGKAPWLVTGAAFLGKMLYRHKFKIFRDLKPEEYFT